MKVKRFSFTRQAARHVEGAPDDGTPAAGFKRIAYCPVSGPIRKINFPTYQCGSLTWRATFRDRPSLRRWRGPAFFFLPSGICSALAAIQFFLAPAPLCSSIASQPQAHGANRRRQFCRSTLSQPVSTMMAASRIINETRDFTRRGLDFFINSFFNPREDQRFPERRSSVIGEYNAGRSISVDQISP